MKTKDRATEREGDVGELEVPDGGACDSVGRSVKLERNRFSVRSIGEEIGERLVLDRLEGYVCKNESDMSRDDVGNGGNERDRESSKIAARSSGNRSRNLGNVDLEKRVLASLEF